MKFIKKFLYYICNLINLINMEKVKILYVHGYGGSQFGNSYNLLKKYSGDKYEIVSIDYDVTNPKKTISDIIDIYMTCDIDYIIGSSLGGFLVMNCIDIPRIILNPCLKPSEELPKIGYTGPIEDYVDLENTFESKIDIDDYDMCISCFGNNDELLGTKFKSFFDKKYKFVYDVESGHHMSDDAANKIMNEIIPQFETYTTEQFFKIMKSDNLNIY